MAILTRFPSTRWNITLDMTLGTPLTAADVTVTGNTVTAVTGAGTRWVLTLGTAVDELLPTTITIAGVMVLTTENAELGEFLQEIRNILHIGLTADDLPDATIKQLSYLRKAELTVYDSTKRTDATYDAAVLTDSALRDRFRIAVMYNTAALLVPALPDIVREEFQDEYRQYVQLQGEDKIALFLNTAKDVIEDDIPTGVSTSDVGELGMRYEKYVAF